MKPTAGQPFRDARAGREKVSFLELIDRHGRAVEWLTSFAMILLGISLLWPGDTMSTSPAYQGFVQIGMTDVSLGGSALVVGLLRFFALYRNGAWKRSPILRVIGAVCGAAFFSSIAFAFQWSFATGLTPAPSTALVYIALCAGDLISCSRAGADAARVGL